ncbi:MAG: LacI family transcriptional regulator [Ignavibacteriales bacterium CG07_land_8_20_14_0_80_59_12]|nr:MAG: LacI family transcriptional regulator [Ignavibacteriales bacterium CG07_land_8_20_14_0_80_59_12]
MKKRTTKVRKSLKSVSRRVTAKEVAGKLGISTMTVSRVMNNRAHVDEETRRKVLGAAQKLDYSPNHIAKSLVLRKTHTIGVVVPEITHSFFPEAIRGIEEATYRARYHLILTHSAEDAKREKDALLTLESERVDGILISTAQSVQDHSLYQHMIRLGLPIVFFDRCVHGIGASCVSIDDEESARRITEHLIDHGYTRIAHLSGPQKVSIGRSRLNGFKSALADRKIPCYDQLIVESGFQETDGYQAMKKLLSFPRERRPRAVVAVNDPAAFGAIKAIQEQGLSIPGDIAIVGFSDDIRAALMPTPLTTVRQPAYEVGKLAAQKLLAFIEGKSPAIEEIIVKTEQVIRRSCGCG